MTLNEYLQRQTDQLAIDIAAKAPCDSCPHCDLCEGQLIYVDHHFVYECTDCGTRWNADQLTVDEKGSFTLLELAD